MLPGFSKILCWAGFFRSVSTNKTLLPFSANAKATFDAMEDFPSFSATLLTMITFCPFLLIRWSRRVASFRTDSKYPELTKEEVIKMERRFFRRNPRNVLFFLS